MSITVYLNLQRLVFISTLSLLLTSAVWAQGTAFTYQSRLNDNGALANGSYDMQFSLFDAVNGGAQIGTTLDKPNIAIANGVFIVQLDFGANAFSNGGQRYLQIAVRPAGTSDPYTEMSPRTEITSTPYAVRSLSAASADNATQLNGIAAGNYVKTDDVRLSDARDPKPGSNNYIQNTTSLQNTSFKTSGDILGGTVSATSYFALGGKPVLRTTGLDNLYAGSYTGSVSNGIGNTFIGSGIGLLSAGGTENTFIGANAARITTTGIRNTFIGNNVGANNGTGNNNIFIGYRTGAENVGGQNNTLVGSEATTGSTDSSNNTAIGYRSLARGSYATAIGAYSYANCNSCMVLGLEPVDIYWNGSMLKSDQGGSIELGGSNTRVGQGTPYIDFHLNGLLQDYNVRLINDASGRLTVQGKLRATSGFNGTCGPDPGFAGLTINCNQDLAESFRTLQRTEPGDVVTLVAQDRDKPTVRKAQRSYDAQLIGVVSTNPGLIFDEGQTHLAGDNTQHITKDKTAVAMVGRVPVKFTLENGVIKVGDALTSSATEPGKAMKATSAGKIIGIALESSDKAKDGKLLMWLQIGHHEPTTTTIASRNLSRKRQGAALVTLKHENATLKDQLNTVLGQLKSVSTRLDDLERAATQTNNDAHNH